MTTMSPEDVAALFDLPPLPPQEAVAVSLEDMEAAEAELAAEIAAAIESGGFAADAPESRTDLRVRVDWPGRMLLPDGRVVEMRVRDVSQGGVGLASFEPIPARTVVDFEMDVPPPFGAGPATPVKGAIAVTYTVAQGAEVLCGATWQAAPAGAQLVVAWIERLR